MVEQKWEGTALYKSQTFAKLKSCAFVHIG